MRAPEEETFFTSDSAGDDARKSTSLSCAQPRKTEGYKAGTHRAGGGAWYWGGGCAGG